MIDSVRVVVLPGGQMDRKNAARAMGKSPKTLSEWSRLGIGPAPFKIGGRVHYRLIDVQAFCAGEAVQHG